MRSPPHCPKAHLWLALTVVGLAWVGRAAANPDLEAQVHLERAMALHANGRYAAALSELTTAYALAPQPELLYAIAQTHVQLGDCPLATIFYQRFLSSDPAPVAAAAAREAIDACAGVPARPPEEPVVPPAPEPRPTEAATDTTRPAGPAARGSRSAWHRDRVGLSLLVGGVGVGAAGAITYGLARSSVDRAATAPTYGEYVSELARGRRLRVGAVALGTVGAVVAVIGGVHVWRHRDHATEVAVAAVSGGGVLSLAGRF